MCYCVKLVQRYCKGHNEILTKESVEEEDCQVLVCLVEVEHRLLASLALKELAWLREQVVEVVMTLHWPQLAAEASFPGLEMLQADCN